MAAGLGEECASISEERFFFRGAGATNIAAYRWSLPGPSRGIIQVSHGLGEHALRYRSALREVIEAGYTVYANDHRGHGASVGANESLGSFGEPGFEGLVADMRKLTDIASSADPELPVVLLGHSMGSFAAQLYILDHGSAIDGLALSGSTALDLLNEVRAGWTPFEFNNRLFQPARTPFDWLSRDEAQVDAYVADPRCGFGLDVRSRISMHSAAARIRDPLELARIPPQLPFYVFAGDADPINQNLTFLHELIGRYRKAGIQRIDTDFYEGARHEVLNETNRDIVVANLLAWLRTIRPRP